LINGYPRPAIAATCARFGHDERQSIMALL